MPARRPPTKNYASSLQASGTSLLNLNGIGPSGAARLLAEVGDITRFPDRGHFPSWNGTAPIDASSGDHVRHRLSRAGNRQINRALHIMATVQLRNPGIGRDYYDRRKAEGRSSMEAMRCLKRRLSDIVYRELLDDAVARKLPTTGTGPGGQQGDDSDSSAAGSQPHTNSRTSPSLIGHVDVQVLEATLGPEEETKRRHAVHRRRVDPRLEVIVLLGKPGVAHAETLTPAVTLVVDD